MVIIIIGDIIHVILDVVDIVITNQCRTTTTIMTAMIFLMIVLDIMITGIDLK
jgi:hypothetical protein